MSKPANKIRRLGILDSISLNMLGGEGKAVIHAIETNPKDIAAWILSQDGLGIFNRIEHRETDAVVRGILADVGVFLPVGVRESMKFADAEHWLAARYVGARLPEGTTTLPPRAEIRWYWVTVNYLKGKGKWRR